MGIDIEHKHKKVKARRSPRSEDPYLLLLVKLYRFLARRTNSDFNRVVLKRLCMSRTSQPPMSLVKLARFTKGKEDKIAVVVGTITDDARLLKFPKLTVCALRVTEPARRRILNAGGEVLTFDQLALRAPTGSNTLLLRGRRTARKAYKHFGAPGVPGSTTRPRLTNRSKNVERSRGRRKSKGFKV
jgi:large subunit ribosomal protein L18e